MVGLVAALVGITLTTTVAVRELVHQQRVVQGQAEKEKVEKASEVDRKLNLKTAVLTGNPEEYMKKLIGVRNGVKVYVASGLLSGNPCSNSSSELKVWTRDGMEHLNVAYVIVSGDERSENVIEPINGVLDLTQEKGVVKVVKHPSFLRKNCGINVPEEEEVRPLPSVERGQLKPAEPVIRVCLGPDNVYRYGEECDSSRENKRPVIGMPEAEPVMSILPIEPPSQENKRPVRPVIGIPEAEPVMRCAALHCEPWWTPEIEEYVRMYEGLYGHDLGAAIGIGVWLGGRKANDYAYSMDIAYGQVSNYGYYYW